MLEYISFSGVIAWLLFSSFVAALIMIGMAGADVDSLLRNTIVSGVVFVVVGILFIDNGIKSKQQKHDDIKAKTEWVAKGCPVYKSQCGSSKHPYECERKAAVVGRNQVGDIFVNGYPICQK